MRPVLHALFLVPLLMFSCNTSGDSALGDSAGTDYDFWVSLEKAQEQAYDQGKHIVLDVYTEWCGFCRRMNTETYGDEGVQKALVRYFQPVRINAESDREVTFLDETYSMRELALQLGVSSYPTTIFISPNGEPIAVQSGYIEAHEFRQMLTYVGSESYQSVSFQEYKNSN